MKTEAQKRADTALAAMRSQRVDKKKKKDEVDLDQFVFYWACPSFHVGVFIVGRPKTLMPSDWWSAHKPDVNSPWPSNTVLCQDCGQALRGKPTPKGLVPLKRFYKKMPRHEFDKLFEAVDTKDEEEVTA